MDELILRELLARLGEGRSAALVTVVESARSVPRRSGSKMIVFDEGTTVGTIGGGEMEARVVVEAVAALDEKRSRLVTYELTDPGRGDPGICGGTVTLFVEPHAPEPTLLVIGGGHVGHAVARVASLLDFRVVVADDREGMTDQIVEADRSLTGSIDEVIAAEPITAETYVVVVTRNAALDMAALPSLLDTPAAYVGVMGSERRWHTTRSRLVDEGMDPAVLDRVSTPIGVEIRAETPMEIAVSILAEIIAVRRDQ